MVDLECVRREACPKNWLARCGRCLFGEKLAASQTFSQLFRDGMKLVEETAAYLDGPGRQESKRLDRAAALGYATESMRLTTRLMQLASWLLLHRAVNEGEMSLAQANKERTKVKLAAGEPADEDPPSVLPERLSDLIDALEEAAGARCAGSTPPSMRRCPRRCRRGNPLERQLGLLRAAFEARALSSSKPHARGREIARRAGKPPLCGACERSTAYFLQAETGEPLLEARQPAAAVEQLLGAAGPGRVRLRIDVEMQHVAALAPGGAGLELGAVGHDDLDGVIIGVNVGLHG